MFTCTAHTQPENLPVWVKIHTDQLLSIKSGDEYSIRISNRTRQKSPLAFSDTIYPLENQSIFMPKLQFSSPPVTQIKSTESYHIAYSPIKISQQIPVYAEYSASPTAFVEIFSQNGRSNS
jgi:hypothetical protein